MVSRPNIFSRAVGWLNSVKVRPWFGVLPNKASSIAELIQLNYLNFKRVNYLLSKVSQKPDILESSTDSVNIRRAINPDRIQDSLDLHPFNRDYQGQPSYSPNARNIFNEQITPSSDAPRTSSFANPETPTPKHQEFQLQISNSSALSLNQDRVRNNLNTPSTIDCNKPMGFRSLESSSSFGSPTNSSTPIRRGGPSGRGRPMRRARCTGIRGGKRPY